MEHIPWIGSQSTAGIRGYKIAIVGNSHWLSEKENDREEVTIEVIENVIARSYNIAFFNQIRSYFGFSSHAEFWEKVVFFNYAPRAIGLGNQRFDHMTSQMAEEAKPRFEKIIRDYSPHKAFVFSKRIRWALPQLKYLPSPHTTTNMCIMSNAPATQIFLLRHPQGAKKVDMCEAVNAALST